MSDANFTLLHEATETLKEQTASFRSDLLTCQSKIDDLELLRRDVDAMSQQMSLAFKKLYDLEMDQKAQIEATEALRLRQESQHSDHHVLIYLLLILTVFLAIDKIFSVLK